MVGIMSIIRNVHIHDGDGVSIGSELDTLKISLHDGSGNPIGSLNGSLDIHDADVHSIPVNKYFSHNTGVSSTLSAATVVGDISIAVVDGSLYSAGDYIEFTTEPHESIYRRVISVNVNVLNLDSPVDNVHSIGSVISIVNLDMNVLGSITSPVSYKFSPDAGQIYHVVRFLFSMTHSALGDLGLFGGIPEITNGAVLRGYDGASGTFRTFMNIKSNADMKNNMFDVDFDTRSGGGGIYGTSGRGSIKIGTGAVPKLDAANGDYFEILIQDDLTGLDSFKIKVQGHIEGL